MTSTKGGDLNAKKGPADTVAEHIMRTEMRTERIRGYLDGEEVYFRTAKHVVDCGAASEILALHGVAGIETDTEVFRFELAHALQRHDENRLCDSCTAPYAGSHAQAAGSVSAEDLATAAARLLAAEAGVQAEDLDDLGEFDNVVVLIDDTTWLAMCAILLAEEGFSRAESIGAIEANAEFYLAARREGFEPYDVAKHAAAKMAA